MRTFEGDVQGIIYTLGQVELSWLSFDNKYLIITTDNLVTVSRDAGVGICIKEA